MKNKSDRVWLYGLHACKAAINNDTRILFEVALLGEKSLEKIIPDVQVSEHKIKTVDKIWFEKKPFFWR